MKKDAENYLLFLDGDENGFIEIVREYKDGLILFINSFVHDIHISEEAADEVFLRLYVRKPHYKAEYSFKTWLYAIAKNTAINYVKKLKKGLVSPIEDYYYISDEKDIEADYIRNEENVQLHEAVKSLKAEYAQVLWLIFFENMTEEETAEIMGKSRKQIYNLTYRAKQALREELEKRGINRNG